MATPIPPSVGAVRPGELYVDLQSRTLWLGVDDAVDPNQAVLISDIENADDLATAAVASAKTYTDSQIPTRAPTVHTHTASQITDFAAAVNTVIIASPDAGSFARGMIMMWSGPLSEIGVGPLAGWSLCDGSNGTPNLRDKFIIGAGNKVPGVVGGTADLTIGGGAHVHTINSTALTIAQMPGHNHAGVTTGHNVDHAHYISGYTSVAGNHTHTIPVDSLKTDATGGYYRLAPGNATAIGTNPAGDHQHTVNFWSGGVNTDHSHQVYGEGGGQGHTHTIVGGTTHDHAVTPASLREAIPYYALAYIMKL